MRDYFNLNYQYFNAIKNLRLFVSDGFLAFKSIFFSSREERGFGIKLAENA